MRATLAGIALVALFAGSGYAASEPINDAIRREIARLAAKDTKLERENARLRRQLRREHKANRYHAGLARAYQRTLRHSATVTEAINLASTAYGVSSSTLWRKATCESHLSPRAKNRRSTASGLFQFLTSTWAGTPYGHFSIWSAYANAMAAGWMHSVGRGGEWVCR